MDKTMDNEEILKWEMWDEYPYATHPLGILMEQLKVFQIFLVNKPWGHEASTNKKVNKPNEMKYEW